MDRISEMAAVLAHIDEAELMEGFLRAILTPAEAEVVSSRWELVKRLRSGSSQRAIARELGVSLCKITRGSRELKTEGSALRRVLERYEETIGESTGTE